MDDAHNNANNKTSTSRDDRENAIIDWMRGREGVLALLFRSDLTRLRSLLMFPFTRFLDQML